MAASLGVEVWQDDVKTAFLNAGLVKPVWVRLPDGRFARVVKARYGLKRSPRAWYEHIAKYMVFQGFTRSEEDKCVFVKGKETKIVVVGIFVDDTLSLGNPEGVKSFRD